MQIQPFGRVPAGEAHLYTMKNRAGTTLSVTDAGAAVVALVFRGVDVVLGWPTGEVYGVNPGSMGATVGRNANRIGHGRFTLNGQEITLAKNEGDNNLHSGPDSYKKRLWETVETADKRVTFLMDSPDGDQGFPGHVRLYASYELTEDDEVHLTYRATSDKDTVINPTNHTYFNLNGQGSGSVNDHLLRICAAYYTPIGEGKIPAGEVLPVEGSPFDFRRMHHIGRDIYSTHPQMEIAGGYDHNFCLMGSGLRLAAELRAPTGVTLTLYTDRPGVQLYTANNLCSNEGKNGAAYAPRGAVCLETQGWPDSVNHPDFPSSVVKAGEEFFSETRWQFTVLEN